MSATTFQRMRREEAAKQVLIKEQDKPVELTQLRARAKELGVENASKLGIKKLTEAISALEE